MGVVRSDEWIERRLTELRDSTASAEQALAESDGGAWSYHVRRALAASRALHRAERLGLVLGDR